MRFEKGKLLKFHDGQYQFKVPFMLYADFASILKQEDDKQQDTMNQIKTEQKGQTASTHMPSGWCVHSALAYIDVLHSMKTYHGKECVEMFVEHI